jgi:hypothetical protein
VAPEILDELDPADKRAVRSRRDLRLVNWFMRGESWVVRELKKMQGVRRVVDLGAGDGSLGAAIMEEFPDLEVTCVDLVPRPKNLDHRIIWWSGDVFDYERYDETTVVVANLFLHHLVSSELQKLGAKIHGVRGVLAAEPYRGGVSLMMSRCLLPFVNDVTRHDMVVSIRAGFRQDELGRELSHELGGALTWSDQKGVFGGIRVRGIR